MCCSYENVLRLLQLVQKTTQGNDLAVEPRWDCRPLGPDTVRIDTYLWTPAISR